MNLTLQGAVDAWIAIDHQLMIKVDDETVIGFSPKATRLIANALKELDHGQEAKTGGQDACD